MDIVYGGLSESEAGERLKSLGYNEFPSGEKRALVRQVLSRFLNPLVLLLAVICVLSVFLGQAVQAVIILLMIFMSVVLSFAQEHHSGKEAEKLRQMIRVTATVLRDGRTKEVPMREIVPNDVVELRAGDMIPADARILASKDFFVDQSSLTGESFPVEKSQVEPDLFMGSSVVSGTATALITHTGVRTKFGKISEKISSIEESSFDKGVRQFVWLMISFIIVLVIAIFSINVVLKGEVMQALLFSLAVAVGLTPEMLPMVITVNLSKGAIALSEKKVIVKRLTSIESLGAMNILCSDKTGTLTMNQIILEKHCDVEGRESDDVFLMAYLNSFYQTGLKNLLDQAILSHERMDTGIFSKVDEIPFDFSRKIMSIVVESENRCRIISKGAAEEIYKRCTHYELGGGRRPLDDFSLQGINAVHDELSADGFRVLALAYKDVPRRKVYSKEDEQGMTLKGYVAFLDPPKSNARETIERLKRQGIRFVVLTGDNELVTRKICNEVGLVAGNIVTGSQIESVSEEELALLTRSTAVFARLSPMQKERIIRVLKKGNVVGYLGDGINDAPSLKVADVGISVDNAVDIAKESADMILLEKNLPVISDGVTEGRKTFANTMKYVRMGASSNLGNMISMAAASLFLPFLPMTPLQILFNNFLYDISQIAIPTDDVDGEYLERPRSWDISSIRRFMILFGPVSSIFDFITFAVLLHYFRASQEMFHTGWFLESLVTEVFIIYVIRTSKWPFFQSRPSPLLLATGLLVVGAGFAVVHSQFGHHFGFVVPPAKFYIILFVIVTCYLGLGQAVKGWYAKKYGY